MRTSTEMTQTHIDLGNTGASLADSKATMTAQFVFTDSKGINMRTFARGVLIVAGCVWAVSPHGRRPDRTAASSARGRHRRRRPPADYVIGPEDQLSVVFWRDKDLSADVVVRPDGKISLPLLNDVQAGGLTPEQLRHSVTEEAKRYVEDPTASVVVRQINSRRVFVTG